MTFTLFPQARLALATASLTGLSVGDALGAQYFVPGHVAADLTRGHLPTPPWPWTDDTEEACCLVAALTGSDEINLDRDRLADLLGEHFDAYRGYGPGAVVTQSPSVDLPAFGPEGETEPFAERSRGSRFAAKAHGRLVREREIC
ncbi:hypothetical protein DMB66_26045 [Actinoplanes sp. ATCC 53533]|nr:hypothetical protein DMB66_26045 [Actinoplanes sp. ATCC 53533]